MRASPAQLGLAAYCFVCTAAIVWPGFAWIPADRPRLLGLPFALVWVVGWSLATFLVLILFHRAEQQRA